ncbi:hypothetical protein APED_05975 [Acanthopleuribacter pedis]
MKKQTKKRGRADGVRPSFAWHALEDSRPKVGTVPIPPNVLGEKSSPAAYAGPSRTGLVENEVIKDEAPLPNPGLSSFAVHDSRLWLGFTARLKG